MALVEDVEAQDRTTRAALQTLQHSISSDRQRGNIDTLLSVLNNTHMALRAIEDEIRFLRHLQVQLRETEKEANTRFRVRQQQHVAVPPNVPIVEMWSR
jgi:hypothetical protein